MDLLDLKIGKKKNIYEHSVVLNKFLFSKNPENANFPPHPLFAFSAKAQQARMPNSLLLKGGDVLQQDLSCPFSS